MQLYTDKQVKATQPYLPYLAKHWMDTVDVWRSWRASESNQIELCRVELSRVESNGGRVTSWEQQAPLVRVLSGTSGTQKRRG